MPRQRSDDEDWDEEEDWEEDADGEENWGEDDEDELTVPCPYCRQEIHEDAVQCSKCGRYVSEEDAPASSERPWWFYIGVALCLWAAYTWVVGP